MKKRLLIAVLAVTMVFSAFYVAAELNNITAQCVDGDLCFYDKSGNEIFCIEATNRLVSYPSGSALDIESGALFKFAGTAISATAAQLNYLSGVVAGTFAPSKAVVLGSDGKINQLDITSLKVGGTTVNATGVQLNYLSSVTAGTSSANKAVVSGADSKIDTIDVTSLKLGGSAVTATTTQVNRSGSRYLNAGTTVTSANTDKSTAGLFYSGSVTVTGGTNIGVSGFSPAFTGTAEYNCLVSPRTPLPLTGVAWKCEKTSSSSITISTPTTYGVTDTIDYFLIGY
jgi:hypothetical protein